MRRVQHVCVSVSPDHVQRRLFLKCTSSTDITVLCDEVAELDPGADGRVMWRAHIILDRVGDRDAMLMVTTEWIVKAAAALSRSIAACGGHAPLRLAKVPMLCSHAVIVLLRARQCIQALLPEHNAAVRRRNEAWRAALDAASRDPE